MAGTSVVVASTLGFYFTRKTMWRINEEREKGGLGPISMSQIVKEVRLLETESLEAILKRSTSQTMRFIVVTSVEKFSVFTSPTT